MKTWLGFRAVYLGYHGASRVASGTTGASVWPSLRRWYSVGRVINGSGLRRLTLDEVGSMVSTGLWVEGARRGYNQHQRKVPSYCLITAYEAQTGQILRVRNRTGKLHYGKASLKFPRELFGQLDASLKGRAVFEMRMNGAFFLQGNR